MSAFKLRDYQREASDGVLSDFKENSSTLGVLYTGGGKTIIFADVIRRMRPQRAMVLAHREELIWQARDKIEATTGLNCEIEMADLRANNTLFSNADVVVGTVQTQIAGKNGGRKERFDPMDFGLLIIDEAHHATSDSYKQIIEYYRKNPDLKILGVTATPDRTDEEALGQIFQSVAFDFEILDGIHDGWLVPVDQQMVSIKGLDFSNVRTTCGDLNGAELAAIMEAESNLQGVVGSAIEIIGDKRALMFTSSVLHAEKSCELFNRHKAGIAEWVCGNTDKDVRRDMLKKYADGSVQIVVNCNCLSEGFDNPAVEVIIQAKPTKSRSLYAQQIGRATRPLPGVVDGPETAELRRAAIAASAKPSCLIVDYVGVSGKHKLVYASDILGGKVSDAAIDRANKVAQDRGVPVRVSDLLDKSEADIQREAEERRMAEERKRAEELRRRAVVAKVSYSAKFVNPFDVLEIIPVRQRGWDNNRMLSEKQRNLLLKQGINADEIPYAQARQLIGEIFHRWGKHQATFKQAKVLKKYGYETKVSMTEATKIIDAIAANGWKKPNAVLQAPPTPPAQSDAPPIEHYDEVPF